MASGGADGGGAEEGGSEGGDPEGGVPEGGLRRLCRDIGRPSVRNSHFDPSPWDLEDTLLKRRDVFFGRVISFRCPSPVPTLSGPLRWYCLISELAVVVTLKRFFLSAGHISTDVASAGNWIASSLSEYSRFVVWSDIVVGRAGVNVKGFESDLSGECCIVGKRKKGGISFLIYEYVKPQRSHSDKSA
jgi:hypothetical protein